MYNDCANHAGNPFPGTLYNVPDRTGHGHNVYKGCVVDYAGAAVTPANYMAVLTGGNTTGGNGRVLKSGANDTVFLAYFDHGAPGMVEFPNSVLYANQLMTTIQTMYDKKMYS